MKATSTKLRLTAASVLGLAFGLNALAQAPRPPQIESPVVHPDRTVTFNFRAPSARKVELSAQFLKANQPLTADTNGVWSVTVGPVEPNLYPYSFVVDGVSVADPANQDLFPNERFKSSLVDTTSSDLEISESLATYWVNFAKRGDPNGEGVPTWPQFTENDRRVMYFKNKPYPGPVPSASALEVLDKYFAWRRTSEGEAWAK